ncbi:SgcJ/EcaC family oxidoreductase [Micromonospora sp. HM5-17]|uniref:YybH family protein n=1 Tax=Micromonospora sp. HM5-17 TaxID=2487710 RepID=UPI000F46F3A5|nr:SgcJ/EcaC family oxidoreductase [Micromonospora sp. HM5-17]ROT29416.1 SgcJ/EcaC family oxidoreductase [Micromonospora sp. HM5-17]
MPTDEEQIRTLIERWAEAVHRGDLAGVVADHAEDVVMFDVPPPYEGVRGLDAYRKAWPPFLRWQLSGARFEIESLDVTAGDGVAFAYALLRCGTEEMFAQNPDNRLRLTLGLRKQDGRWVVTHEHHSFPYTDQSADDDTAQGDARRADPGQADPVRNAAEDHAAADAAEDDAARDATAERELRELHERWFAATAAKDLDGLMAPIADDIVSYEHDQPLAYVGVDAVREVCRGGLDAAGDGAVTWTVPDMSVLVRDDLAVVWGLNLVRVEQPDGGYAESWSRGTRVFRRRNGAWTMVHQHLSYPYDPATGVARTDLRP